ncbi:hypothetical protein FDECE_6875 [Fusarium decemcellulare]|nr:hypothetical protein FDECE_6875 [Fusarium decemcellulare]
MSKPTSQTPLIDDIDWSLLFDSDLPAHDAPPPLCDSADTSPQATKRRRDDSVMGISPHPAKKQDKKKEIDIHYSCPYRRRNPRMFNIRDFQTCANQSFASITLVKRHVMSAHQSNDFTLQCPECKSWFRAPKALDSHLKNQTCSSLPPPAVDEYDKGITEEMEVRLRDRRAKTQVLTWKDLWRTLFPCTEDIIAPDFEPILERDEAREQFYQGLSQLDHNTMLAVRDVLLNPDVDPVEVVRKVHHIVDTSPPRAQRTSTLVMGALPDELSVTLFR